MSYISKDIFNRLPYANGSPVRGHSTLSFDTASFSLVNFISSTFPPQSYYGATSTTSDNNNNSCNQQQQNDVSQNATTLAAHLTKSFPLPAVITNQTVTQLCQWIGSWSSFSSSSSSSLPIFLRKHVESPCDENFIAARILSLSLVLCTELEKMIRKVPGSDDGDDESQEGIGLLNQVVKSRVLLAAASSSLTSSSSSSDAASKSSNNESNKATPQDWAALVFLLKHVLVDGKGMHLRNLLWHGYLMPTETYNDLVSQKQLDGIHGSSSCSFSSSSSFSSLHSYDRHTCSMQTLFGCTFLVAVVVQLMVKCYNLNKTNDNENEKFPEKIRPPPPPEWNKKLFASSSRMSVFYNVVGHRLRNLQQLSPPGAATTADTRFLRFNILRRLNPYLEFISQHSAGSRHVVFPLLCVVIETLLRGLVSELTREQQEKEVEARRISTPSSSSSSSASSPLPPWFLIDTADDRYYLTDLEDLLSWQGIYSLQHIEKQKGVLRRGIQRLRDISDEIAVAASSPLELPLNILVSSNLIPLQLFIALRGILMTLLPVGPRLRDLYAHGKLDLVAICGQFYRKPAKPRTNSNQHSIPRKEEGQDEDDVENDNNCPSNLDFDLANLIQETLRCCLVVGINIDNNNGNNDNKNNDRNDFVNQGVDCEKLITMEEEQLDSFKGGGFYKYLHMNVGTASHFIYYWYQFQWYSSSYCELKLALMKFRQDLLQQKQKQHQKQQQQQPSLSNITLSLKHGLNRKLSPTVSIFDVDVDVDDDDPESQCKKLDDTCALRKNLNSILKKLKANEILDANEVLDVIETKLERKINTMNWTATFPSWIQEEIDLKSQYAMRSSLAVATAIGRLLQSSKSMIDEAFLHKWPIPKYNDGNSAIPSTSSVTKNKQMKKKKNSANSSKNVRNEDDEEEGDGYENDVDDDGEGQNKIDDDVDDDDDDESENDRHASLVVNFENLRIIHAICVVIQNFLLSNPLNNPLLCNNFNPRYAKTCLRSPSPSSKCLLDVTLPCDERFAKSFARNLPVVDCAGSPATLNLKLMGKLMVAVLDL